MDHPKSTLTRAFWMGCACLLLLPRASGTEPSLPRHKPSALSTWPSASHTHDVIRTSARSYRSGAAFHLTPVQPHHHGVHDEDREAESSDDFTLITFAPLTLLQCALPRAPDLTASYAGRPQATRSHRSFTPLDPFLPRPPPTHSAL
jgi:hypothetical protein